MEVSNFLLENIRSGGNIGALQGWDREPKKLWPTLQRTALEDAWGFSLVGGLDYLEAAGRYSGIVTQRGDVGLWLKVIPPFFNNLQKGNLIRPSDPECRGIGGESSYLAFFHVCNVYFCTSTKTWTTYLAYIRSKKDTSAIKEALLK